MPVAPGHPTAQAGQEATVSTRPAPPDTTTKNHRAAAAPGYGPVFAGAWLMVAV